MNILILGASGMIGSTMLEVLSKATDWNVAGAVRSLATANGLAPPLSGKLIAGYDLAAPDQLVQLFAQMRPDVVVNCAGLTKHLPAGNEPISALTMNALLPHRLAALCDTSGARLIHVSTDCVFSGSKGFYSETDHADATDVYGKTKHLGEVTGPGVVTLRTSTIGHERGTRYGLLEWFLAQTECKGYRRAVFSGLPTVEFAKVVRDVVIPNCDMAGLYNVGARPIDKDSLLRLIAKTYGTGTAITADDSVTLDRSLDVSAFGARTGYVAADWDALVSEMHRHNLGDTDV